MYTYIYISISISIVLALVYTYIIHPFVENNTQKYYITHHWSARNIDTLWLCDKSGELSSGNLDEAISKKTE